MTIEQVRETVREYDEGVLAELAKSEPKYVEQERAARARWFEDTVKCRCQRHGVKYVKPVVK